MRPICPPARLLICLGLALSLGGCLSRQRLLAGYLRNPQLEHAAAYAAVPPVLRTSQ